MKKFPPNEVARSPAAGATRAREAGAAVACVDAARRRALSCGDIVTVPAAENEVRHEIVAP